MKNIHALRQRKIELTKKQRGLLDKAAAENRNLTEAEAAEYDDGIKALVGIEAQIEREEKVLSFERAMQPIDDANEGAAAAAGAPSQKKGFTGLGEMLRAVVANARTHGRVTDQRLLAAATGASETVPSDGGFLVQKDISSELLTRVYTTGQIASRCRRIPISSNANGMKMNAIDEDSRADGSRFGGVRAYWINEADASTKSKPAFRQVELQLQKLAALYYATDELLEDAAALEAVATMAFQEEMTFKVEDAIFNGTGAGQPLGFLNSGAVIPVAKDSGDSTATVTTPDILNMWSRLFARSRSNAAWFIDQSVEPKLYPLTLGSGSLGQILLYTPPGRDGNALGSMLGAPVVVHEHGAALGTPGDIVLADLSQYLMIDKGGVRQDYSMHVNFTTDEGVFRFIYRVDGQTWWKKPLTPKSGGPTQAPFISLATRP